MITRRRDAFPHVGQPARLAYSSRPASDRASAIFFRLIGHFVALFRQPAQALLLALLVALAGCGGGGGGGGGTASTTTTSSSPSIAAILLSFPSGHVPAGATSATHNGYVAVYVANASTGAPISNATVTFNGTNVPYYVADQGYSLDVSVNSGDNVALNVTVDGTTYSVSTTQVPSYPTISAPAPNATWLNTVDNIATWSGVVPNSQSMYMIGVTDTGGQLVWPTNGSFRTVSAGTTSYTINGNSVTPGDRLLMVGIASVAWITNAAANSALVVAGFDYAPITMTDTPPPALTSIAVTPAHSSVGLTQTQQFTATGTYADNSSRDLTTQVTWQSSAPSKATISSSGLATGVASGPTTISANLGGISGSAPLVIFQPDPSPIPPLSQAVAYQIDYAHSGRASFASSLSFPSTPTWSVTLDGSAYYPLIAGGKVFVLTSPSVGNVANLYALDETDGHTVWGPIAITGTYGWGNYAYDHGKIFVVNFDGRLYAFDAASGASLWNSQMPSWWFAAPITAVNGVVHLGGSGIAYAVDEITGNILSATSYLDGSFLSPAVSGDGVYIASGCQVFKLDPITSATMWHFASGCSGGGGSVPAVANGLLYVRDLSMLTPPGQVFDSATGTRVGTFVSAVIPALSTQAGYFMSSGTLQAIDLNSHSPLWSFSGDGQLVTAPIVVNDRVIIGSSAGHVFALDAATGAQTWSGSVPSAMGGPNEGSYPLRGLGAGEGYLVVPAGNTVTAWRISP